MNPTSHLQMFFLNLWCLLGMIYLFVSVVYLPCCILSSYSLAIFFLLYLPYYYVSVLRLPQAHIHHAAKIGVDETAQVTEFWLIILTSLPGWQE